MFKQIIFAFVLLYVSAIFATRDCRDCRGLAKTDKRTCNGVCKDKKKDPLEFNGNKNLFKACKLDCKSDYFSSLAGCYDETSIPQGACV